MRWIKLTHNSGDDLINVEQVYRITKSDSDVSPSTYEIVFYDANSILPISYGFANETIRNQTYTNLEKLLNSIDIDQLANQ